MVSVTGGLRCRCVPSSIPSLNSFCARPEVAGQLGDLRAAEQDEHDHQDDDALGTTDVESDHGDHATPWRHGFAAAHRFSLSRDERTGPRAGTGSGAEDAAGGLGPLAADAAALTLGEPAPDAELLAVLQGELEALGAHHAARGTPPWPRVWTRPFGEEQVGVDAETVGVVLPTVIVGSPADSKKSYMWSDPLLVVPAVVVAWSERRAEMARRRPSRRPVRHRRNYVVVILAYHITFAQGGISRPR